VKGVLGKEARLEVHWSMSEYENDVLMSRSLDSGMVLEGSARQAEV
jgi:hypothetical protein